jgi:hypothetical protein
MSRHHPESTHTPKTGPKSSGWRGRTRRTVALAAGSMPMVSSEEDRQLLESLASEAHDTAFIRLLESGTPTAHRAALQVLHYFPTVKAEKGESRIDACVRMAPKSLERSDRRNKKAVAEGLEAARNALTVAQLVINKRLGEPAFSS